MNHKRLYYCIEVPRMWWVRGVRLPVHADDPRIRKRGAGSTRTVKTIKAAMRLVRDCPPGTTITRVMYIRGKRPRRYVLMEWEKT